MKKTDCTNQLRDIISAHYVVGDLIDFEQIYGGSVNESFLIKTATKGRERRFFVRKYKPGKEEEEIEFEHSIIKHLKKKHFDLVAGLIQTKYGKTFVKRHDGQNLFYAVFDYLGGEDKYKWVDPKCSDADLKSASTVLAMYHSLIFDLKPEWKRSESRIIDLLPEIADKTSGLAAKTEQTPFDTYLQRHHKTILSAIERTLDFFWLGEQDCEYKDLVQIAIHCDFHPGNLKFQNNTITGLFDFDWSKVDVRCFDVALALTYFCTVWEVNADDIFDVGKAAAFLHEYQKACTFGVGPLSDKELKHLPAMIGASNIYVMNWVVLRWLHQQAS